MRNMLFLAAATGALSLAGPSSAAADDFPACQSQDSLVQVIQSDGELQPDDCSSLTVTRISTENGDLCVIDFAGAGEGVLNTLRDAALPEKWWVRCDPLGEATEADAMTDGED